MKAIKLFATAALLSLMTACGSNAKNAETAQNDNVITVDDVLANPDQYVDQEVTLEGVCSHLCKHGGRKAFIVGSTDNNMLRCEATPEMGGAFPKETIHQVITVTGILRETRIGEDEIREMERQQSARVAQAQDQGVEDAAEAVDQADTAAGCATEKAAQGQGDINSFNARMADYRARIAQRDSVEQKPYLSFYHLETTAYSIQKQ